MSGRIRPNKSSASLDGNTYSKRCQRDLDRFYSKALKDTDNHFTKSFQETKIKEPTPSSSFSVISVPQQAIPKAQPKVKHQKSHTYSKIRHKCNEVLHLSIECTSSEDVESRPISGKREKRVKFRKNHKSVEVQPTSSSRKIPELSKTPENTEEKDLYFNEIFYQKTGEIERDVQGFVKLNYNLVTKYLTYESSSYKHKLLQALRWRLNLTETLSRRTIQEFVKYDLLRIKLRNYEKNLMETLLWPSRNTAHANYIQNSMARLINGIVSLPEGREYVGSSSIVNYLIWGGENELYKVEPSRQFIDNNTAGMLVAAIQKISTIPWQRRDMVNKNMLRWVLEYLEDIEYSGTNFQMKYSIKLLNSLLKVPEAVDDLTGRAGQVLALLARYLRREKVDFFFTVKSILVKLFKHELFRKVAKEMNFETIFRKLINPMDIKSKKEFDFMILYLNDSGNITQLPCSASNFEIEEKVIFDPEIDQEDPLVNMPGLDGELLFEEQFAKFKPKPQEEDLKSERNESGGLSENFKGQGNSDISPILSNITADMVTEKDSVLIVGIPSTNIEPVVLNIVLEFEEVPEATEVLQNLDNSKKIPIIEEPITIADNILVLNQPSEAAPDEKSPENPPTLDNLKDESNIQEESKSEEPPQTQQQNLFPETLPYSSLSSEEGPLTAREKDVQEKNLFPKATKFVKPKRK